MAEATSPCDWELEESICCPDWSTYSEALQAQAQRWATYIMWAATGRQFNACEITVYPCGRDTAGDMWWSNAGGWWWDNGVYVPYIWQGQWYNAWCGCGSGPGCYSCKPKCAAYLPGPVAEVVSVEVDGAIIDPALYRVWDQKWLTRIWPDDDTENECWPMCQDYNAESPGFKVVYVRGTAIPQVVLDGAAVLACEYAKACLGAECLLPSRVVNVARQGVTVTLQSIDEILRDGFTGITSVDQIIAKVNPKRLNARTRLYSPDVQVDRMISWP
jgi:hypothetical protein